MMNPRKIVKSLIPKKLFNRIEPFGHLLEAMLFNVLYGFPARKMKVIGVTGTNGKTTTSYLIHKMMVEAGISTGLMTTVAYGVNDEIKPQIHHMTNVPVPELMKRLKWMRRQGVDWLVLETTSQALAQNRVWGVPYSLAVMTNVTHEHLDFHRTFANYVNAKRKLFKLANTTKQGLRTGVINAEDQSANKFVYDIKNPLTYGLKKGDVVPKNLRSTASGSSFELELDKENYKIKTHLPGSFNVQNCLATALAGYAIGLNKSQIEQGIAALESVEGRMTKVDEGQDFDVVIDFAHTPDSFEKLFKDLKPVVKGNLIVMFGSAGRRDEAKRAEQGELAGKYADEIIITEEDDRDIDGKEIMEQIAVGAVRAGKKKDELHLVHDRSKAINYAIKLAKKGDTVLLLGKGHEKTIERANGENPWDEIGTARTAIKNILK